MFLGIFQHNFSKVVGTNKAAYSHIISYHFMIKCAQWKNKRLKTYSGQIIMEVAVCGVDEIKTTKLNPSKARAILLYLLCN